MVCFHYNKRIESKRGFKYALFQGQTHLARFPAFRVVLWQLSFGKAPKTIVGIHFFQYHRPKRAEKKVWF